MGVCAAAPVDELFTLRLGTGVTTVVLKPAGIMVGVAGAVTADDVVEVVATGDTALLKYDVILALPLTVVLFCDKKNID